jgi:hypothetical protein
MSYKDSLLFTLPARIGAERPMKKGTLFYLKL